MDQSATLPHRELQRGCEVSPATQDLISKMTRGLVSDEEFLQAFGTADGAQLGVEFLREAVACPWPCQTPRWWPTKVLAVMSR